MNSNDYRTFPKTDRQTDKETDIQTERFHFLCIEKRYPHFLHKTIENRYDTKSNSPLLLFKIFLKSSYWSLQFLEIPFITFKSQLKPEACSYG